MLVNLLLQDGKSNYMEGLMRKSTKCKHLADSSHRPIPCHRPIVHSVVMQWTLAKDQHAYTRYPKYANLDLT